MRITKTILAIGMLCAATLPGLAAAELPSGQFRDEYGTTFSFSPCGDGTDLCGVLLDIQGKSRTAENLAYLNQQVMRADQVAANQWKGTLTLNGSQASATVTQVDPDTVEIQGCRGGLLCQTLVFNKV